MTKKTPVTLSALERFEAARASIKDGEERNLSYSTMQKRYKVYFAAEDAVKAAYGVWA